MPTENQPLPLRQALQSISDSIRDGALLDMAAVDALNEHLASPAQHQGEPVALPERKDPTQQWHVVGGVAKAEGWNACLDEIAKLGPLYTRPDHNSLQRSWQAGYDTAWYAKNPAEKRTSVNADTGEVERLRRALKFYADRDHFAEDIGTEWDSVSGEPANVLWHEHEAWFVEDGSIARAALSKNSEAG